METQILHRKDFNATFASMLLILTCVFTVQLLSARQLAAQDLEIKEQRAVATLEERLNSGLRARTEKEKQYLKNVSSLVQQGKLPKSLVDSTFLWVKRRKASSNYPFFYFKRVLELRAKALRLPVPQ